MKAPRRLLLLCIPLAAVLAIVVDFQQQADTHATLVRSSTATSGTAVQQPPHQQQTTRSKVAEVLAVPSTSKNDVKPVNAVASPTTTAMIEPAPDLLHTPLPLNPPTSTVITVLPPGFEAGNQSVPNASLSSSSRPSSSWAPAEPVWRNNRQCIFGRTIKEEDEGKLTQAPADRGVLKNVSRRTEPAAAPSKPLRIPRVIYHTNARMDIPKGMYDNMQRVIAMNPEFAHEYFDDAAVLAFVTENCGAEAVKAFHMLKPASFKADLFRYCLLYHRGGVYLDCDIALQVPLLDWLQPTDEFVSADDNDMNFVYNAVMAVAPKNKIVAEALKNAIARILARDYGDNPLSITGPRLLANTFKAVVGVSKIERGSWQDGTVRLFEYRRPWECMYGAMYFQPENIVLLSRYPTFAFERRSYMPTGHYDTMWHQRNVFHD